MSEDRKKTITLGDQEIAINPIDLGTLKVIGMGSAKMQSTPSAAGVVAKEAAWYDGTYEVIAAATKPSPDEKLEDGVARVSKIVNVTLQQLLEANKTIFLITGLVIAKEEKPKPGEGEGAAAG